MTHRKCVERMRMQVKSYQHALCKNLKESKATWKLFQSITVVPEGTSARAFKLLSISEQEYSEVFDSVFSHFPKE